MSLQSEFNELSDVAKIAVCLVGVYVLYNIYQSFSNPNGSNALLGPDPNDTTGNPNSVGDTSQSAYAGNGALGYLGNLFNQALGGLPQSAGNAIGGLLAPNQSEEQ